jgi:hypothetical protein
MILLMWLDEADKDYQLAAGISKDVEADDSILSCPKHVYHG